MKRGPSLPIVRDSGAPAQWRSIDERSGVAIADGEPGGAGEFPAGASELDGVSRRSFIQLVGAGTALATVGAACRKPPEKIVPFVRRPEEVTPGNALHFATAYELDGYASGLLVESHEGRPTKIEGNPQHPETLGATTTFEQALILGLYDQNRAKQLSRDGVPVAWRSFLVDIAARARKLAENAGAGLRFLVEPTASPLMADLRRRIVDRFPKAKFVSYSSLAADGAVEGTRLAYGSPLVPRHQIEKARVILALDADFLGDGPEQTRLTRELAAGREPGPNMNRLYVVEPAMTITGAMADHRARMRGTDVAAFTAALAAALAGRPGLQMLEPLASLPGAAAGRAAAWDPRWLAALAADLERNRGRSLVIAGRRQPAAVHALAAAINAALGNVAVTVSYDSPPLADHASGPAALGPLVEEIATGMVDTLVITARNPAYTAPVDFKLAQLLRRVPSTIYHTLYEDETAAACRTIVPAAHALESWGDARALDGTASIVQPLISPLWGGIAEVELVAAFLGEGDLGAHELVQRFWRDQHSGSDFDQQWEKWLADGIVPGPAGGQGRVPIETISNLLDVKRLAPAVARVFAAPPEGMEVGFAVDPKTYDGRFGNNTWLQELPHPITKLTWDNAVMISEATATAQGLETGDVVEIAHHGRTVEGPIMIVPGHADDAVTLPLGYGRTGGEETAGGVGFNAGAIRDSAAVWYDRGATLTKTGRRHKFAITQDHWRMSPDGAARPRPAVTGTVAEVRDQHSELNEELEERRGPVLTIHKPVDYSSQPYSWGMAIDLSKCTGCSACVVACQSENNIPTVGKENVRRGREMQWLRIDRYFEGSVADPQVAIQPLACVHCETAPCEYVCPVNATVHSDEGLNEMVYNRCIGTRYCSNNCPYKVRRFNFLAYNYEIPAARRMGMNPEVTVRSRGVMEKCTYCVQRIERKRIETRIEGRTIRDGELLTACQQGCPAEAIVFGSLNDPNSKVSRLHRDERRYDLLHELGTRPRTAYLARVRNPNPDIPSPQPAPAEGGGGGGER
jgi:molybdopterin-containing oxidoreductase family iron-sulfur binding subunit